MAYFFFLFSFENISLNDVNLSISDNQMSEIILSLANINFSISIIYYKKAMAKCHDEMK